MLLVISEIILETELTIAELARILARLFSSFNPVASIVAFQLYELVVQAKYQPCRNPLRNEVSPFTAARRLADERQRHRA